AAGGRGESLAIRGGWGSGLADGGTTGITAGCGGDSRGAAGGRLSAMILAITGWWTTSTTCRANPFNSPYAMRACNKTTAAMPPNLQDATCRCCA
ncbi:hypothetical protein CWS72_27015, partial [Telmatospirillum siberiense]